MDSSTRQGALVAVLLGAGLTGAMVLGLESLDTTPTALSALPLPHVTFGSRPPAPTLGARGPDSSTPSPSTAPPVAAPPVAPPSSAPPAGPVLPSDVRPPAPPPPAPPPTHATAQGPRPVALTAHAGEPVAMHPFDTLAVSVSAGAVDPDGYVTGFLVDYGDGTVVHRPGDRRSCAEDAEGWPLGRAVRLDPEAQHVYATPGTYHVRVTAFSAGCDGTVVQSATTAFTWRARMT